MSATVQSVASQIRRRLPGEAVRNGKGEVDFRKGRIIYSSPRIQYAEMDHPSFKLIWMAGSTFMYFCRNCQWTVWEEEIQIFRAEAVKRGLPGLPPRTCPFCCQELDPVQPGDKVRLHYRYDARALTNGNWWAERWDW